ncbi:MAG: hypothetical protein HQM15_09260 [Deltaproteobacteria bacterium]|nr:hypothetical protein [Deltaproteobacteria bacterium]
MAKSSDFEVLKGLLPKNLRGISLSKPEAPEKKALEFYKECREPYVARYLTDVGEKLLHLGQAMGALKLLEWASNLEKSSRVTLMHAWAKLGLGRLEEAEQDIKVLLKWHPRNSVAQFLMGKVFFQRSDHQKAQEYFALALRSIEPSNVYLMLLETFSKFNQILIDRDSLYSKKLSSRHLYKEIEGLKNRAAKLKQSIEKTSNNSELQGIGVYLEGLEKLFESWLAEMGARPGFFKEVPSTQFQHL